MKRAIPGLLTWHGILGLSILFCLMTVAVSNYRSVWHPKPRTEYRTSNPMLSSMWEEVGKDLEKEKKLQKGNI